MNSFLGLPVHGLSPSEISDSDLLTQILTLSRIFHFVYDMNRRQDINPTRMHDNYGDLLCSSELTPLLLEGRERVERGSSTCAEFFSITNQIIHNRCSDPNTEDGYINNADHIAQHPLIKSQYYRKIIGEPLPTVVRVPRFRAVADLVY